MAWNIFAEVKRKIFHLLILFIIFGYVLIERNYSRQIALISLVGVLALFLLVEYLRLELGWRMTFFENVIRPKEREHYYGIIYFLSATIICLAVFDYPIALASLLMTTFGDMSAALFGKKYGKVLVFRKKTVVGTFSELIVNIIVGFFILKNVYIIITMAFTATLVETFVSELDDNLFMPVFTALAGQILTFLI